MHHSHIPSNTEGGEVGGDGSLGRKSSMSKSMKNAISLAAIARDVWLQEQSPQHHVLLLQTLGQRHSCKTKGKCFATLLLPNCQKRENMVLSVIILL